MDGELVIRSARPEDRRAMERICAETWDWGDYIPEVWDEWLADQARPHNEGGGRAGPVIVAELGGQVVALSKITFLTRAQVWLEGMRVDPRYRRRGIAGRFLDYSLNYAHARGARVVRLGTGVHNTPVHNIVARAGMERVGTYLLWTAEPLLDGGQPAFLNVEHAAQVQAFLRASSVLAYTGGLYSVDWAWQELSADRVRDLLDGGQIVTCHATGGKIDALAIIHTVRGDERMWIGFADGQPAAVVGLARAIRVEAAQAGAGRVDIMLPDLIWLRDAFQAAGYGYGDWDGELWIYERWLGSRQSPGARQQAIYSNGERRS